jgi:hypothetical protein
LLGIVTGLPLTAGVEGDDFCWFRSLLGGAVLLIEFEPDNGDAALQGAGEEA